MLFSSVSWKTCYLTPSIRMNGCCFMIKINSSCGFCQENPPGHYYCSGIHQFFNRYGEILTSGGRFPPVSEGKWCRECALFQGINLKKGYPINSLILFFSVILNITLHRAENYKCFFKTVFWWCSSIRRWFSWKPCDHGVTLIPPQVGVDGSCLSRRSCASATILF